MDAKTIKKVIDWARSVGREDSIVFHSDNNDHIYANNATSTAYFDEANEMVVCLRTNANPIRSTMNEPKYEIFCIQFEHITNISFKLDIKEANQLIPSTDFDPDDAARVLQSVAPVAQATTFQRDKDGNFKQPESNRIKGVSLGIATASPEIKVDDKEIDPNKVNPYHKD
jgi:hypothetical protein